MTRSVILACLLLILVQTALAAVPMACADIEVRQACHGEVVEIPADIGCELRCAQAGSAMILSPTLTGQTGNFPRTYSFVPVFYRPPLIKEIFHPPIAS